jgi:regulator of sigma E protease
MAYLGIVLLLSLLIVIHEAGHLAAARAVGIPVEAFSVGLGPKLWARRWGRVEYSLRALPLGGFVLPAIADEEDWRAIPLRKRLAYFLGGPLANLLAALPLMAALNVKLYGASLYQVAIAPFLQLGRGLAYFLTVLPAMLAHPSGLSGAVGIVAQGGRSTSWMELVVFAVGLSVSLAVLNLLPIPVLDGGQILLCCLEKVFPRAQRLRLPLTVIGLIFLAAVMIFFNLRDVVRLLSPHSGV